MVRAALALQPDVLPLRTRFRAEANCQIVHDSLHTREGWVESYLLFVDAVAVGFGSVAIAGPWQGKPTIYDFYVLPDHRPRAFHLFEAFLQASGARHFEVQTSDELLNVMLFAYGRNFESEKIVFQDGVTTTMQVSGATLHCETEISEIREAIRYRAGGGDWRLDVDGAPAGKGGILFHYNRPYGDIWMEIAEPFRRRGLGAWLVQELKRECYALGAIPAARCSPANIASRLTLQRAGLVPYAHIILGELK